MRTAEEVADGFLSALGSHGKFANDTPEQIHKWNATLAQALTAYAEQSNEGMSTGYPADQVQLLVSKARAEALEEIAKFLMRLGISFVLIVVMLIWMLK